MRRWSLFKFCSLITILMIAVSCYQGQADEVQDDPSSLSSASSFNINQLFETTENPLFILIYSPTCPACLSCFDVLSYQYNIKPFTYYSVCYEEVASRENKSNIGVNKIEDINVYSVPCLFKIENKMIVEEIFGFTSIQTYIINMEI